MSNIFEELFNVKVKSVSKEEQEKKNIVFLTNEVGLSKEELEKLLNMEDKQFVISLLMRANRVAYAEGYNAKRGIK
ncbi:hypothetical protein [Bacillus infantis]|uniref:hypothetical protein n=1 Tax=Bacillus infantis TaxID=324767 RepID=UPI003CEA73C5